MKMMEVEVYTENGGVFISQPNPPNEDECIVISPEQVAIVTTWMIEAAKKAVGQES